mmetsp:Transcript_10874/g.35695  ORF Transcript_10874/g.35695 Transcript_10874/m.35695 type:complete len:333 (+) Transcript_10874:2438-3436(+)
MQRRLVRRVDAGETLDEPLGDLLVQALRVARLDDREGHVHEDLHEGDALLLVQCARGVAIFAVGRDEGDHGDDTRLGEEGGHVRRAPDGLGAVVGREAEVLSEAGAQVVAVDPEDVLPQLVEETALERLGDGGLARAGQARHPERDSLLADHARAVEGVGAAHLARLALCDVDHVPGEHLGAMPRDHLGVVRLRRRGRGRDRRALRDLWTRQLARRARLVLALGAGGAGGTLADGDLRGSACDVGHVDWRRGLLARRAGLAGQQPRVGDHANDDARGKGEEHREPPPLQRLLAVAIAAREVLGVHRRVVVARHIAGGHRSPSPATQATHTAP